MDTKPKVRFIVKPYGGYYTVIIFVDKTATIRTMVDLDSIVCCIREYSNKYSPVFVDFSALTDEIDQLMISDYLCNLR